VLFAYAKLKAKLAEPDRELVDQLARTLADTEIGGLVDVPREDIDKWFADIPRGAPDDLRLVASRPLFDVVEELIARSCHTMPELIEVVTKVSTQPVCYDYVAPPGLATNENHSVDEWLLLTGLDAKVDLIVSDELGVRYWTVDAREVQALDFDGFVDRYVNQAPFRLDQIDGDLLVGACHLLQPAGYPRARFS
jgi:hypothetical protein